MEPGPRAGRCGRPRGRADGARIRTFDRIGAGVGGGPAKQRVGQPIAPPRSAAWLDPAEMGEGAARVGQPGGRLEATPPPRRPPVRTVDDAHIPLALMGYGRE